MSAHLYIHTPFCRSKCLYCDFYSVPGRQIAWGRFVDALLAEAQERREELPSSPDTIYIGGGTPSLMPLREVERMLDGVREIFGNGAEETTIELNPDDVTAEYVNSLVDYGVNRFSMGVQSFNDDVLRFLRRRHNAEQALKAAQLLIEGGRNVSLDLIFGLPGQSLRQWERDVATAVELRPSHISCYALMLEEGTPLTRMVENGEVEVPDQELSALMYEHLRQALGKAGYEHYEISNYALPGYHSRHNSAYWTGAPYLGLGPGAHSYDGSMMRRFNPADKEGYMKRYADGIGGYRPVEEVLGVEDLAHEYLLTRLRTARGMNPYKWLEMTPNADRDSCRKALEREIAKGNLTSTEEGRVRIPASLWLTADPVISALF